MQVKIDPKALKGKKNTEHEGDASEAEEDAHAVAAKVR